MGARGAVSPSALLDQARARGVTLSARGDDLVVDGPAAALKKLRPALRTAKPELLALLQGHGAPGAQRRGQRAWSREGCEGERQGVREIRRRQPALAYLLLALDFHPPLAGEPVPQRRELTRQRAQRGGSDRRRVR